MTPELIGNMVYAFGNIPDYIRKIERKRIATEKSLDARKKKVQYLEDEGVRFEEERKRFEDERKRFEDERKRFEDEVKRFVTKSCIQ